MAQPKGTLVLLLESGAQVAIKTKLNRQELLDMFRRARTQPESFIDIEAAEDREQTMCLRVSEIAMFSCADPIPDPRILTPNKKIEVVQ